MTGKELGKGLELCKKEKGQSCHKSFRQVGQLLPSDKAFQLENFTSIAI